jgi:hypothetical protein
MNKIIKEHHGVDNSVVFYNLYHMISSRYHFTHFFIIITVTYLQQLDKLAHVFCAPFILILFSSSLYGLLRL